MNQQIKDNQNFVSTIINQFNDGLIGSEQALSFLQNAEDFILRHNGGADYDALCSQVIKAKVLFLEA
mgnify:CR=1 FL=1